MNRKMLAASLVAAAGVAATASATIIDQTSFEAPGYTVNPLAGQNGWIVGSTAGVTAANAANVVNNVAGAHTGSQYVQVQTSQWTADTTSATYRISASYLTHGTGFSAATIVGGGGVLHTSVAIRMDTPSGTRGGFATGNNYATDGVSFFNLPTMGLAWTGSGLSSTAGNPFNTPNTSYLYLNNGLGAGGFVISQAGGWLNSYHVMDIFMNFGTGLASFSVDGASLDSILDTNGYSRSFNTANGWEELDFQAERDRPVTGASSGGAVLHFDDYLSEIIAPVPAPSSVALMGLGGLIAARRRRS